MAGNATLWIDHDRVRAIAEGAPDGDLDAMFPQAAPGERLAGLWQTIKEAGAVRGDADAMQAVRIAPQGDDAVVMLAGREERHPGAVLEQLERAGGDLVTVLDRAADLLGESLARLEREGAEPGAPIP
jgi:hypothetical protein